MKGIGYLTDDKNILKGVVIDLKTIENHPEELRDSLNAILAQRRLDEPTRKWEEVKKNLRNKGKL